AAVISFCQEESEALFLGPAVVILVGETSFIQRCSGPLDVVPGASRQPGVVVRAFVLVVLLVDKNTLDEGMAYTAGVHRQNHLALPRRYPWPAVAGLKKEQLVLGEVCRLIGRNVHVLFPL